MKEDRQDLTTGSIWGKMLFFSIPLVLTNFLQVLFNMADIAVIGQFAGSLSLGAVGSTSTLVTLFTGFLIGMGGGTNVLVARFFGAKDKESTIKTIHTALLVSMAAGAIVLVFGDRHASYRILRAVKNRFGSTNEIGVFEMQGSGLEEVSNPSEYLLEGRPENASGCVVACSMEGTRPILVEIQALVCESNFGIPRRTAVGTDFNRVNLLMAVLEKKVGLRLASSDAYVNIAGSMKMTEPAIDLGICLAIASSMKDIVIPDKLMAFGEIGLSGEVRAVSMAGQRVQEAKKLGFDTVILPEVCRSSVEKADGIKLVYVRQIQEAIRYIMSK